LRADRFKSPQSGKFRAVIAFKQMMHRLVEAGLNNNFKTSMRVTTASTEETMLRGTTET
jgi:hypothetical protein